jgi:hypothetical protein
MSVFGSKLAAQAFGLVVGPGLVYRADESPQSFTYREGNGSGTRYLKGKFLIHEEQFSTKLSPNHNSASSALISTR